MTPLGQCDCYCRTSFSGPWHVSTCPRYEAELSSPIMVERRIVQPAVYQQTPCAATRRARSGDYVLRYTCELPLHHDGPHQVTLDRAGGVMFCFSDTPLASPATEDTKCAPSERALQARIGALESTLAFYANRSNYANRAIQSDGGAFARRQLDERQQMATEEVEHGGD